MNASWLETNISADEQRDGGGQQRRRLTSATSAATGAAASRRRLRTINALGGQHGDPAERARAIASVTTAAWPP